MCLLVHKREKVSSESRDFFRGKFTKIFFLPITTETCARFREILKAGVKEFGEVSVLGRNVWTEGRLRSYVWLKFPAR